MGVFGAHSAAHKAISSSSAAINMEPLPAADEAHVQDLESLASAFRYEKM